MADTIITPLDNGPNLVTGSFRMVDVDGNAFEIHGDNVALCRCGASAHKPFCDGTHKKIGFESRARAGAGLPHEVAA